MSQVIPQTCPRCGFTSEPQQRNCPRCGLDLALYAGAQQPGTSWQAVPQSSPVPPVTPPIAALPKRSGRGRLGCVLILLALLLVLGGVGYAGYTYFSGGLNPGQPTITTTTLNTSVTYAGATVTVLSVGQAQSFSDDPTSAQNGMLRARLQTQNKTSAPVNLIYSDIVQLVLPGGKVLKPVYAQASASVVPGETKEGFADFSVPTATKPAQLVLRLGGAKEAQMDIPLTGNADLSKYEPKKTDLHGKLQYAGLDWTLVNATSQWSIDGQQASSGQRFVTLTVMVDNTLAQTAIPGSVYDYMRLKAGNDPLAPVATTLPVSFEAGAKGKTGAVTFPVPQNINQLTLVLHSQHDDGFRQATANLQL